jgi:hypothetical protein
MLREQQRDMTGNWQYARSSAVILADTCRLLL